MYKVAQASIEVSNIMLEDTGVPASYIRECLAKSLAHHIIDAQSDFNICKTDFLGYSTRFTTTAIVFLNKKDLEQYVKQQAKKMIDNGSVA